MTTETKRAEGGPSSAMLGSAALGFLVLVVLQNVLRGVLGPSQQASGRTCPR